MFSENRKQFLRLALYCWVAISIKKLQVYFIEQNASVFLLINVVSFVETKKNQKN